jgi:hypothetical protein
MVDWIYEALITMKEIRGAEDYGGNELNAYIVLASLCSLYMPTYFKGLPTPTRIQLTNGKLFTTRILSYLLS